jgi:hypothetical protein
MIQNKYARLAFYFFLILFFLLNVVTFITGLNQPGGINPGGAELSAGSIRQSEARWIAYHVWVLLLLAGLGWAELSRNRGLFLLLMFLTMILFYYPFIVG